MLAYIEVQVVALHFEFLQLVVGILGARGVGKCFIERIGEVLPDVEGVGVGSLDESESVGALKVLLEVCPSPKVCLAGFLSSGMGNWLVLTSDRSVV